MTSFNSVGNSDFGCLFSKCCLYVFGSGIWDCSGIQYDNEVISTVRKVCFESFLNVICLPCKCCIESPKLFGLPFFVRGHCGLVVSLLWRSSRAFLPAIEPSDVREPFFFFLKQKFKIWTFFSCNRNFNELFSSLFSICQPISQQMIEMSPRIRIVFFFQILYDYLLDKI